MKKEIYDKISDIADKIQDLADELLNFGWRGSDGTPHHIFKYDHEDLYKVIKEIRDYRDYVSSQGSTETKKEEA